MRVLAIISFSFAAGALLALAELPLLRLIAAALFAVSALLFLCLARRSRRKKAGILALIAALSGFLYTSLWRVQNVTLPESLAGQDCACTVELTAYPRKTKYGYAAEGKSSLQGRSFRVMTYFYGFEHPESLEPGCLLAGNGSFSKADDEDESFGYYRSVGIPLFVSLRNAELLAEADPHALRYFPVRAAHRIKTELSTLFPEDVSGMMTALLTGDKSGLSYGDKTELKLSGIYHAFAVSGMHVSILMSCVYILALRRKKLYPLIGIPILLFYCLFTGMTYSVLRASVMQLFLMLAPLFDRESDPPTAMGSAVLFETLINPYCLVNVGMLLSYSATAGMLLFAEPLFLFFMKNRREIGAFRQRLRRFAAASASGSVSALSMTLPLTLFCFGTVPLFSPVCNLLTVWAITACFVLAFPLVLLSLSCPAAARLLRFPVLLLARYVRFVSAGIASVPFAALYPQGALRTVWIVFSLLVTVLLFFARKGIGRRFLLLTLSAWTVLVSCSFLVGFSRYSGDSFSFTALDVGQGQCLILESQGSVAVIDCGGSFNDEAGELLSEELLRRGYRGPDLLIFTHYDSDHVGGAKQLFRRLRVGAVFLPDIADDSGNRDLLIGLASEAGVPLSFPQGKRDFSFGSGSLSLLPPPRTDGGNESCLSVLADFGGYDVLVTGDLPANQELLLLEKYPMEDVELLVAGHHGARSSTSQALLDRLRPEIVLISVGENRYGHPTEETLERIASVGARIFRTDLCGTVTVRR